MSTDADTTVELPFGAAYDRLQEVAAELGADATMAPDRLIALLREGKGLERALRDHLERVEQEVRAIEEGDGAVPFRIADGARPATPTSTVGTAPTAPASAPSLDAGPTTPPPTLVTPEPSPPAPAERAPAPPTPGPPTLGFDGDDDIPF